MFATFAASPTWTLFIVSLYLVFKQFTKNNEFFLRMVWESLNSAFLIFVDSDLFIFISSNWISLIWSSIWNVFPKLPTVFLGEKVVAGIFLLGDTTLCELDLFICFDRNWIVVTDGMPIWDDSGVTDDSLCDFFGDCSEK